VFTHYAGGSLKAEYIHITVTVGAPLTAEYFHIVGAVGGSYK